MTVGDVVVVVVVASLVGMGAFAIISTVKKTAAEASTRPMIIEMNGKKYQEMGRSKTIDVDGITYIELIGEK